MGRGAKVAISLGAAFVGLLIGSWATTLFVPIPESECVTTSGGTSCTLDAREVWRWLLGGVPGGLMLAGLALVLLRRYERRFASRFVEHS